MCIWMMSREVILAPKAGEHSVWDGVGDKQEEGKRADVVGREQRRLMPWYPPWWPHCQLVMLSD